MNALTVNFAPIINLTDKQFFQLCQQNELIQFERNADGTLIMMPLVGGSTSNRNANLTSQLEMWNQDDIGIAFGSCTGFTLPNKAVRSPSASWLQRRRWNALTTEQKETFAPVCPDFVVELRSDTNCLKRLQNKMLEYWANGTQLGWLIDRKSQQVEIYRANTEVEIIASPMALSGETVLPGFILNLEPIW